MKIDRYTKVVLTVIAVFLGIIIAKDVDFVTKAHAGEKESTAMKIDKIEKANTGDWDDDFDCYAKNMDNVYLNGVKIEGARAEYFEVLPYGYAKDDRKAYYRGKVTEAFFVDDYELNILTGGYATDRYDVFYKGKKMEGAKKTGFEVLK